MEVVIHLLAHLGLDVFLKRIGIRNEQFLRLDFHFCEKLVVIFEDLVEARFLARHMVPFQVRAAAKGWREREICGSPNFSIRVGGGDGNESEGDVFLFAQADGGDGSFFWIPEQAEVLLHAGPLPAAIGNVFESGLFHTRGGFDCVGEE